MTEPLLNTRRILDVIGSSVPTLITTREEDSRSFVRNVVMRHHHGLPRFADKGAKALDGTKAAIDTVLDFQAVVGSMVSIQATTSTASGLRIPPQRLSG